MRGARSTHSGPRSTHSGPSSDQSGPSSDQSGASPDQSDPSSDQSGASSDQSERGSNQSASSDYDPGIDPGLAAIAEAVRGKSRASRALVQETVLALCKGRFLAIQQIGTLLDRAPVGLRLRFIKPLVDQGLLERRFPQSTLVEIGEGHGETLLAEVQEQRESPSLAHFVRSLVGLDRAAAQAAFSEFLGDRSLTPPQIRFVEMVIDQLTARGVMDASALYERPFSDLNAGGPEALFSGRENIVEGIFKALRAVHSELRARAS